MYRVVLGVVIGARVVGLGVALVVAGVSGLFVGGKYVEGTMGLRVVGTGARVVVRTGGG